MTDQKEPTPAESERTVLINLIDKLEKENKSLKGQLDSASPEVLEELKVKNKELKSTLLKVEKDLAKELTQRKLPIDAGGMSDTLQVFKTAVISYCTDRKLDPPLWKKLESL